MILIADVDAARRLGPPHLAEVAPADPLDQLVSAEYRNERARGPRVLWRAVCLAETAGNTSVRSSCPLGQTFQVGKLIGKADAVAGQGRPVAERVGGRKTPQRGVASSRRSRPEFPDTA